MLIFQEIYIAQVREMERASFAWRHDGSGRFGRLGELYATAEVLQCARPTRPNWSPEGVAPAGDTEVLRGTVRRKVLEAPGCRRTSEQINYVIPEVGVTKVLRGTATFAPAGQDETSVPSQYHAPPLRQGRSN